MYYIPVPAPRLGDVEAMATLEKISQSLLFPSRLVRSGRRNPLYTVAQRWQKSELATPNRVTSSTRER